MLLLDGLATVILAFTINKYWLVLIGILVTLSGVCVGCGADTISDYKETPEYIQYEIRMTQHHLDELNKSYESAK